MLKVKIGFPNLVCVSCKVAIIPTKTKHFQKYRHRTLEGLGGEILSKSAQHNRNKPQESVAPQEEESPASAVQKWFSNILKPQNQNPSPTTVANPNPTVLPELSSLHPINSNLGVPPLPPRQITPRKSRFQNANNASQPHLIPPLPTNQPSSKRTFKTPANLNTTATNPQTILDAPLLSPPKHLVESAQRRSISSSTCSVPDSLSQPLSPPRNFLQPAHRNSISVLHEPRTKNLLESHRRSTSTAVTHDQDRILPRDNFLAQFQAEEAKNLKLNGFLKEQRIKMEKIMKGESNVKAKIVLSGATNS